MGKEKKSNDINILVIGETGVGKSTFINAIANYFTYPNLDMAKKNQPLCLIPSKFVVTDDNLKEEVITVGADKNENGDLGQSATQRAQAYAFRLPNSNKTIRIIDTPGIADTRGLEQDNKNFEDTLNFISQYDELHAICFLFKPNNARITVQFEYCIKHLMSRLERSATKNIIFVFTNSRGSLYRPGDTFPALKEVIKGIEEKSKDLTIPLNANNVFCMDNESFRFLMVVKNSDIKFSDTDKKNFEESWKQSREKAMELLEYIVGNNEKPGLAPHKIKDTLSVNEARRVIIQLAQPMADISELICNNVSQIERHKKEINKKNQSIGELKEKLYIPQVDIQEEPFTQPRTVCTSAKCRQIYKVLGQQKFHYPERCHDPCYLTNVQKEVVNCPELINCACINRTTNNCVKCGCNFLNHMHIYYATKLTEVKVIDKNVNLQIKDREGAALSAKQILESMEKLQTKHKNEQKSILQVTAKFAVFLKNNAISPYNDAYKAYIEFLIDREKSLGDCANMELIHGLNKMLSNYLEEKRILDEALLSKETKYFKRGTISTEDIFKLIGNLFSLELNGKKIKKLYESQNNARSYERNKSEYVHPSCINLTTTNSENKKLENAHGKNTNQFKKNNQKGKWQNKNNAGQHRTGPRRSHEFPNNFHSHHAFKSKQNFPSLKFQNNGPRGRPSQDPMHYRNPAPNGIPNSSSGPRSGIFQHYIPVGAPNYNSMNFPYQEPNDFYNNRHHGSQNYGQGQGPYGSQNYGQPTAPQDFHNYRQDQGLQGSQNYGQGTEQQGPGPHGFQNYGQGPGPQGSQHYGQGPGFQNYKFNGCQNQSSNFQYSGPPAGTNCSLDYFHDQWKPQSSGRTNEQVPAKERYEPVKAPNCSTNGGSENNIVDENKTFGEGATGKYIPKPKNAAQNVSEIDTLDMKYKEMSIEKDNQSFSNKKSGATKKFNSIQYYGPSNAQRQCMGGKKKRRPKPRRSSLNNTGTVNDSVGPNKEEENVEVASEAAVTLPNTQELVVEENNSVTNVEQANEPKDFFTKFRELFKIN